MKTSWPATRSSSATSPSGRPTVLYRRATSDPAPIRWRPDRPRLLLQAQQGAAARSAPHDHAGHLSCSTPGRVRGRAKKKGMVGRPSFIPKRPYFGVAASRFEPCRHAADLRQNGSRCPVQRGRARQQRAGFRRAASRPPCAGNRAVRADGTRLSQPTARRSADGANTNFEQTKLRSSLSRRGPRRNRQRARIIPIADASRACASASVGKTECLPGSSRPRNAAAARPHPSTIPSVVQ